MSDFRPVIFLAFANARDDTIDNLRNLSDEARQLRDVLEPEERSGLCEVVVRSNSTADDIFRVFQNPKYRDRIAVFHYGGHANGNQLLLESDAGELAAADAGGLAKFLGQQKGLHLVFLNGCFTEQQTKGLLDENIPVVISTSQSIDDKVATDFAHIFYRGLASEASLRKAYSEAAASVQATRGGDKRGLYFDHPDSKSRLAADRWPWDLCLRPGSENADQWSLRGAVIRQAVPPNLPYDSIADLFKGREHALAELEQRLTASSDTATALVAKQAIHGLGGIGKTRLAVEYAWRHALEYTALLFVPADTPQILHANLAALSGPRVLNLPEQHVEDEQAQLAASVHWLAGQPGWLLIFDSVDRPDAAEEVERILPQLQGGHVLITSRITRWSPGIDRFEVDALEPPAAVSFLLERMKPTADRSNQSANRNRVTERSNHQRGSSATR